MFELPPSTLAHLAEIRRRELPASVAVIVLIGGLAAAIMGVAGPVAWAALMTGLLIADAEILRRLDVVEAHLRGRAFAALTAWSALVSAIFTVLPAMLWVHGGAAAAAAAMALWIAGVVRHLGGAPPLIALAGAAPPGVCLLFSPLSLALFSSAPDWDLAVIVAVGGGALLAYVAQARLGAFEAQRAFAQAGAEAGAQRALGDLLIGEEGLSACLIDDEFRILAATKGFWANLGLGGVETPGAAFDRLLPWRPEHWRGAIARALAGESTARAEDTVAMPTGARRLDWQARPWRDPSGAVRGAYFIVRDAPAAPRAVAQMLARIEGEADLAVSGLAPVHRLASQA